MTKFLELELSLGHPKYVETYDATFVGICLKYESSKSLWIMTRRFHSMFVYEKYEAQAP